MKRIVHITPALPPVINGLGDFCKILATNLEACGYDDNVFLVRHNDTNSSASNVISFVPENFSVLLSQQLCDVVILHYVGYAYDRWGMPFYMINALHKFRLANQVRVLVFFHELYASNTSPFSLAFYTNPLQKHLVRKLYRDADAIFTNCNLYCHLLEQLIGTRTTDIICTGIFSNVPDDLYDNTVEKDDGCAIVFGSYKRRRSVYDHPSFYDLVSKMRIKTLFDIGPGRINVDYPDLQIRRTGSLLPEALAAYLNKAKFGLLHYTPDLLGKSGILSAYAAFGVIPVNVYSSRKTLYDGLTEGVNYFRWKPGLDVSAFRGNPIKQEVLKWYKLRNQRAVAEKILNFI